MATLETVDEDFTRPSVRFKVISKGYTAGYHCYLYVNGVDHSPDTHGYNIVVVDEFSGSVLDSASFDIYGSTTAADAMADYINDIPVGRIVLVGIRDDGSLNMSEAGYRALESLGSSMCREVGYRDSHALIARKGAVPGTVQETLVPNSTDYAEAAMHKVDVRAKSAGEDDGDFAKLYVGGSQKALNTDGYNLVVVNESTGAFIEAKAYDNSSGSTAVTNMINYINGLSTGRIVLVAVKGDGSVNMTSAAYTALESLGSAHCREIEAKDSWALIGVKGAQIGGAPEILVDRFNGYADIENAFPLLYQTEGYKFVYQDQINSTRQVSNSNLVRDYYPYGETYSSSGTTTFEFSQKEYSSSIGLYYFGARYYNPGIGRWLTPDPITNDFSPYGYCHNKPLIYTDPDGEFPWVALGTALLINWVKNKIFPKNRRSASPQFANNLFQNDNEWNVVNPGLPPGLIDDFAPNGGYDIRESHNRTYSSEVSWERNNYYLGQYYADQLIISLPNLTKNRNKIIRSALDHPYSPLSHNELTAFWAFMGASVGVTDAWLNKKTGNEVWDYLAWGTAFGAAVGYSLWYFPQMSYDPDFSWGPDAHLAVLTGVGMVGGYFNARTSHRPSSEYWKYTLVGGAIGFGVFESYLSYYIARLTIWWIKGY